MTWVGPPSHKWTQCRGINYYFAIKASSVIGAQGLPIFQRGVPILALRSTFAALQIFKSCFIGGNHSSTSPSFNAHVADGHSAFHRQRLNSLAAVFQNVALSATGTNFGDDGQDEVLGSHTIGKFSINRDGHRFERLKRQCLCGKDVFDFTGSDAKCKGPKGAMR